MTPQGTELRKFRFHKGGLQESIETTVEVTSLEALKDHINKESLFPRGYSKDDIKIKPYCFDPRTGWDTHLVSGPSGVIGFMDGNFE